MPTPTVRSLAQADWEAYRSLRLEALTEAPESFATSPGEQSRLTPDEWRGLLRADGHVTVLGAFVDDRLVGIVALAREVRLKKRHKGVVQGMYVTPACRGQGIGRLLMDSLLAETRAAGLEQVTLSVVVGNVEARGLYASLGFTSCGIEPRAMKIGDRYLDDETMVLFLNRSGEGVNL